MAVSVLGRFGSGPFWPRSKILLLFYGQWEKTLPSLGPGKQRVASLTPSKSYQVHACQIKAPRINSYYFLNQSFYFTIFYLVSIWQEDPIKFWQRLSSIYYGSLVERLESLSLAQSLSSVCCKSLLCKNITLLSNTDTYSTLISYCNTRFFTHEMNDLVLSLTYHQLLGWIFTVSREIACHRNRPLEKSTLNPQISRRNRLLLRFQRKRPSLQN